MNLLSFAEIISQSDSGLVWRIFSIIKGPLKPNLLPNIKEFLIILMDLCFYTFQNLYPPKKWEKLEKLKKV